MHRIDGPGATNDNKFTEGDPANGTRATVVTQEWLNSLQEEVASAIEENGLVLNKSDLKQLSKVLSTRSINVGSVVEGLADAVKNDDQAYVVAAWDDQGTGNGGLYFYRAGMAKSSHDGVNVVSPTVPKLSQQSGSTRTEKIENFKAGSGESAPDGDGVFVKSDAVSLFAKSAFKVASNPELQPSITATASIIFDGGYAYNLDTISTYLVTKGVRAGFAVPSGQLRGLSPRTNSSTIGTSGRLSYVARLGHDVINHGLSSVVSVSNPLGPEMLEQEVAQSYRELRGTGVGVKGWVAYFSNLDPANVESVTRKHAIPFGQPATVDARDFSTVTIGATDDISDNRIPRASLESVIDENGVTFSGTTAGDISEKLRVHKLLADYCAENGRHVVLYHHDVSNGEFPQEELGDLIDYYSSISLPILSPAEQFQAISNVSVKEAKIEALQDDVGELFSREGENLIRDCDLRAWTFTQLSGSAPSYSYAASKTTSALTISLAGDSTGAAVRYLKDIPNLSGLAGGGGNLSFSFGYRSDVDDTFSSSPPASNGKIRAIIQAIDSVGTELARTEKTYPHIDTHSRIAHVSLTDLGHTDSSVDRIRLLIDVTPGDGTARDVSIENPTLNRGDFAARFRHSENYSVVNQTVDADLDVSDTWQPVLGSAQARSIRKIVVTAGLVGEEFIRGQLEISPAIPGTYTVDLVAGTSTDITFTLDDNFVLTVDSKTGLSGARIRSAWVYI